MQRNVIEEFYRELDATDEQYVRRKYATGGYAGWKSKHAKSWLDSKDEAQKDKLASATKFWTMVAAVGTGIAAVAGVISMLHH